MKRKAHFQRTFAAQASFEKYGRKSKREQFLDKMNEVVPWTRLLSLVEPHYPKAGNGRRPVGLEIMLRSYFVQQWFNLSDPGIEDALYDSASLRRFVGVDLGTAAAPDETTILRFRHLLEEHDLGGAMLDEVNHHLAAKGIRITTGTIVDATIIHAPSSTKNSSGERDPEMHQTKKGNQWYFGLKAHIALQIEGGSLDIVEFGECESRHIAEVYMPLSKALFSADVVYNHAHLYLQERHLESWLARLNELETFAAGRVETIHPGHGEAAGLELIAQSRTYLHDFADAITTGNAKTAEQYMLDRYPGYHVRHFLTTFSIPAYFPPAQSRETLHKSAMQMLIG